MPDDNPYAAPQTLEPQQATPLLPVAEGQNDPPQRRKFVEWDTARLKKLWQASCLIKDMQGIWLVVCLMMPIIAFFFSLSIAVYDLSFDPTRASIGLGLVALTFTRFGTGYIRTSLGRVFAMVMDGLLGLICLLVTLAFLAAILTWQGIALAAIFFIPIIPLIGYYAACSLRALWQAPELFGPQRLAHDDLEAEVRCREQHQLE
jgi:hypothetical protein